MRKFCFICGRKTDKLVDGRCETCAKESVFVQLPEKIEITRCGKCKRMLLRNRWVDFSPEKIAESAAKVSGKIRRMEAIEDGKTIRATFNIAPPFSDREVIEMHEAALHTNRVICPTCARKYSGYYEAVLQMRGFSEGDMESMGDIFDMIGRKSFYSIKEVKGGFDVKIGDKLIVDSAAKDIRKRFPKSETKGSSKIVTKIDGRDIYRKFILIRKPENKRAG